jgi:8-amino-7-oxononanoate synthase
MGKGVAHPSGKGQRPTTLFLEEELNDLRARSLYRRLKSLEGAQSSVTTVDGRQVLQFASNNYLGLCSHPKLKLAAKRAIEEYGCGSGASRLVCGNTRLYDELEERICRFKGAPSALVFSTGYMANIGTLSALVGAGDIILSDELNHASLIDGCRLSRATVEIFRHRDVDHVRELLNTSGAYKRKLIVTDGVFSMDGDIAPLPELVELCRSFSCMLMVDDAHGTGVLGDSGRGTAELFKVEEEIDIHMGTLGKALGGFGAYIAGSSELRELLVNRSRSFIFTTALPPPVLAAGIAALDLVDEEPEMRKKLWSNVDRFRKGLTAMGYAPLGETHIIPICVGEPSVTMKMSEMLFEAGIFVQGIRPPTVPQGSSRLRITVTTSHTEQDIDFTLEALKRVGKKLHLI